MAEHKQSLSSPGRRRILKYGATLGGAAAVSSFISVEALGAGKAKVKVKVNMQLGWLASNGIMGEVVAKRISSSRSRRAAPVWMEWPPSPQDARRAASSPPARR